MVTNGNGDVYEDCVGEQNVIHGEVRADSVNRVEEECVKNNEDNRLNEEDLSKENSDENKVDDKVKMDVNEIKSSYASIAKKHDLDNKLNLVPTEIGEDGIEVVVFDEETAEEGSKKWALTVCVYFVGYKMSYQELTYNLYRTWGKFGLRSIIPNGNGVFLFKFKNEDGIKSVVENGPWMFRNLPLEAWSTKGISAIASRLGTPLIMDSVTANMCNAGNGRVGFARVLIEVDIVPKTVEEIAEMTKKRQEVDATKNMDNNEFVQVRNRKKPSKFVKQPNKNKENNHGINENTVIYKQVVKEKSSDEGVKESDKGSDVRSVNKEMNESPGVKTGWNVHKDVIASIRKSANKYSVLDDYDDTEIVAMNCESNDEEDDVYEVRTGSASKMSWTDNALQCNRWCRILVGWNADIVRKLWSDLNTYKSICNNIPWVLLGDINVSLNIDEHSEGISHKTQDMEEFQDCVNSLKIKDVVSTGFHFTLTKSLLNPDSSILKKIDRVMGDETFFDVHKGAHTVFLPYDKEFKQLLEEKWNIDVEGFAMFKLVKKLKAMKPTMNKLNWQNGNLMDKVKRLKRSLMKFNCRLIRTHMTSSLEKGVVALKEYSIALEDEEKLAYQRAKVSWLNEGDRNSAFFHKVIKSRIHRSKVDEIWGTDNVRYSRDQVPIQFVKHFQDFLGHQKNKECLALEPSLFLNKINQKDAVTMIEEVSNEEIKAAMFSIDDNKAPGPDGYTAKFFKKAWHSAFIPERQITDNILLTQELLKGYNCTKGPKSERHEFFKGGRGLRQGDPMSPYLFTIVMEKAIDKFSCVSGLFPNLGKSTILCGSMDRVTIESILEILPFKIGKLPVKYLGVPLVAKKIGVQDCKGLIDKVKAKIHDWKNKSLSYAGRAQLIASVIFKAFLWNQGDLQRGKAKVSWKEVCQPKQYGGLGFKSLDQWNHALLVKHLWNVAAKKDSLWVPVLNPEKEDKLLWCSSNGATNKFSSNQVWKDIRTLNEEMKWWKVIWFSQNVPRQAFVLWMASKGRLITQDKLSKWYPGKDWKCPLCKQVEDSHKHLFFECVYSKTVWKEVQSMANFADIKKMEDCMTKLANLPCKNSIWSIVRRLCVADTVYHLWNERNSRIFKQKEESTKSTLQYIMRSVGSRLMTLKVKDSNAVKEVESKWEIQFLEKKSNVNRQVL
uniref:RNA-directed DNA polymerase, eukaryota, reverse transcriptase zinc-binding domain protein n=1 Tax=Tanacetum cinerariifolium TaxID=118510 RepID=A0A6L2J8L4_TANCI|nr:hypothetical protein [Tanacetum cinerariifolium]